MTHKFEVLDFVNEHAKEVRKEIEAKKIKNRVKRALKKVKII